MNILRLTGVDISRTLGLRPAAAAKLAAKGRTDNLREEIRGGKGMRIWVVVIVSGFCSCLSFSMSLLAFRSDGSGAVLFAGFGLFSGAFFATSTMRILAENGIYRRKIDDKISGHPKPASFVPHWFIMAALTVTVIAVLSAIVMPILRK